MRKLLFVLSIILFSCATSTVGFKVTELKYNEVFGASYEHYEHKLFNIFCGGTDYTHYEFVKYKCMYNTARFVHIMGFEYFSILTMDEVIAQSIYVTDGIYIPYASIKHNRNYMFLLLNKSEIDKHKNFYKVSDYYIPSQSEKENPVSNI